MEAPVLRPYREEFDRWLDTATEGLCAEAKERIGQEIGVHYGNAIDAHREEGLSEDEAYECALTALGSPSKAARAFRRTHLTEGQAEQLRNLMSLDRTSWSGFMVALVASSLLPWIVAAAVLGCFFAFLGGRIWLAFGAVLAAAFVFFSLLKFLIRSARRSQQLYAERTTSPRPPKRIVFQYMVGWYAVVGLACLGVPDLADTGMGVVGIYFGIATTVLIAMIPTFAFLPLWLKLRRGADFNDPRGRGA